MYKKQVSYLLSFFQVFIKTLGEKNSINPSCPKHRKIIN